MSDETPPMPASQQEWEVHWSFYRLTVAERDQAWREIEKLRSLLRQEADETGERWRAFAQQYLDGTLMAPDDERWFQ